MLRAINEQLAKPLPSALLDDAFESRWPLLEAKLAEAAAYKSAHSRKPVRDTAAMLDEILTIVRAQERRVDTREPPQPRGKPFILLLTGPRSGIDSFKNMIRLSAGITAVETIGYVGQDNYELSLTSTLEPDELRNLADRIAGAVGIRIGHDKEGTRET